MLSVLNFSRWKFSMSKFSLLIIRFHAALSLGILNASTNEDTNGHRHPCQVEVVEYRLSSMCRLVFRPGIVKQQAMHECMHCFRN